MKGLTSIIILLLILSCGTTSQQAIPKIKPEIPIAQLYKKGIVPLHKNYKQSYFKVLPYLFYNKGDNFNQIAGDFFNVKFNEVNNFNVMVGFWKKYKEFKNVQVILVSMSETSTLPLKEQQVTATSSKHGDFQVIPLHQKDYYNKIVQQVLLINPIAIRDNNDILQKIYGDVITVTISGNEYVFLNPELLLD